MASTFYHLIIEEEVICIEYSKANLPIKRQYNLQKVNIILIFRSTRRNGLFVFICNVRLAVQQTSSFSINKSVLIRFYDKTLQRKDIYKSNKPCEDCINRWFVVDGDTCRLRSVLEYRLSLDVGIFLSVLECSTDV